MMIQNIGMDVKPTVSDEAMSAFFARLKSQRFYGTVEVVFESGRIVRLKKHETLLEENVKEFIEA